MSRKSKIDPALKVELVERYLEGEISAKEAGRLAGLAGNGADTFHKWVNIYRNEGPEGLLAQSHNRHYSEETKLQAVYDYLDGKGSQMVIAARYGLRSKRQLQNQEIAEKVKTIHERHPDMGYRRIRDELDRHHDIDVNDKRILRICRKEHIQSTIKWKPKSCTRNSNDPVHIAKNYLNRDFHADAPNEKWLTDVTEFKYYIGIEVHKVYLSAILDLYDRRIVASLFLRPKGWFSFGSVLITLKRTDSKLIRQDK